MADEIQLSVALIVLQCTEDISPLLQPHHSSYTLNRWCFNNLELWQKVEIISNSIALIKRSITEDLTLDDKDKESITTEVQNMRCVFDCLIEQDKFLKRDVNALSEIDLVGKEFLDIMTQICRRDSVSWSMKLIHGLVTVAQSLYAEDSMSKVLLKFYKHHIIGGNLYSRVVWGKLRESLNALSEEKLRSSVESFLHDLSMDVSREHDVTISRLKFEVMDMTSREIFLEQKIEHVMEILVNDDDLNRDALIMTISEVENLIRLLFRHHKETPQTRNALKLLRQVLRKIRNRVGENDIFLIEKCFTASAKIKLLMSCSKYLWAIQILNNLITRDNQEQEDQVSRRVTQDLISAMDDAVWILLPRKRKINLLIGGIIDNINDAKSMNNGEKVQKICKETELSPFRKIYELINEIFLKTSAMGSTKDEELSRAKELVLQARGLLADPSNKMSRITGRFTELRRKIEQDHLGRSSKRLKWMNFLLDISKGQLLQRHHFAGLLFHLENLLLECKRVKDLKNRNRVLRLHSPVPRAFQLHDIVHFKDRNTSTLGVGIVLSLSQEHDLVVLSAATVTGNTAALVRIHPFRPNMETRLLTVENPYYKVGHLVGDGLTQGDAVHSLKVLGVYVRSSKKGIFYITELGAIVGRQSRTVHPILPLTEQELRLLRQAREALDQKLRDGQEGVNVIVKQDPKSPELPIDLSNFDPYLGSADLYLS